MESDLPTGTMGASYSAAIGGGTIIPYAAKPTELLGSRHLSSPALRLAIRTGVIARWTALLGYAFALFLLLSGRYIEWIFDNLRRPPQAAETSLGT
jgi:hypothetical protein